mgnify:CR=1 FL=1
MVVVVVVVVAVVVDVVVVVAVPGLAGTSDGGRTLGRSLEELWGNWVGDG